MSLVYKYEFHLTSTQTIVPYSSNTLNLLYTTLSSCIFCKFTVWTNKYYCPKLMSQISVFCMPFHPVDEFSYYKISNQYSNWGNLKENIVSNHFIGLKVFHYHKFIQFWLSHNPNFHFDLLWLLQYSKRLNCIISQSTDCHFKTHSKTTYFERSY